MRLALEKIAEMENIQVTDSEIDDEIKRLAEAYGMGEEEIRKIIDPENIKKDIMTGKAVDIIKENAVIKKPAAKKTATKKSSDEKADSDEPKTAKKPAAKKVDSAEKSEKPVTKRASSSSKKKIEEKTDDK